MTAAERDAVLGLEISAAQLEFAGDVGKSLAACEAANPAEVAGLAVRVDDGIVGWIVLKRGTAAPGGVEAGERHVGRVGVERTMSLRL